MSMPPLALRADASASMGIGHLMRCLSLGRAFQNAGGHATFITACRDEPLLDRIKGAGLDLVITEQPYPSPVDLEVTLNWLGGHPGAWLALDGYQFDFDYQRQVKESGACLLVIDDYVHAECYHADLIINQNINAELIQYPAGPETKLLLGTSYAMLSPDFDVMRDHRPENPEVARRVLVTLGGGDPDNQTLKVINALSSLSIDGLETIVLVGAANPNIEALHKAMHDFDSEAQIVHNAANMPELMAWADVAICAGGSTCWELAFMGVPMIVIVLAENQTRIAEGLDEVGAAVNLGWFTGVTEEKLAQTLDDTVHDQPRRAAMSRRGRDLVDGHGCERVVEQLGAFRNE